MKLIHLSDLHIGKRVNDFSMLEDQKYIFKVILGIIDDEKPQGVIIAGDIYDKSVPSAEAVQLFDDFIVKLAQRKLNTFVISGNHDSAERIAFGNRLMDVSGIHMSPVYNGAIAPLSLQDEFGKVNIFMLPFIKPANVRPFFEGEEIHTYTDAVKCALSNINIDESLFDGNWVGNDGSAIENHDCLLNVTNTKFINNVGIHSTSSCGTVSFAIGSTNEHEMIFDNCIFENNSAVYGITTKVENDKIYAYISLKNPHDYKQSFIELLRLTISSPLHKSI